MSHICLQFGQCGNQLGFEFFTVLYNDISSSDVGTSLKSNLSYCSKSRQKWFRQEESGKCIARSVLIDTENKVIKNLKNQTKSNSNWKFDTSNCISGNTGGAANNWALGYCVRGPDICENAIDVIRRECERCDRLQSILSFSSSAGGTGSGVGSYVMEKLCDELPNKCLMNFLVLPLELGETVTQNYNTLFNISKLYDKTDAIFFLENDYYHKITTSRLLIKSCTYTDLNEVIAQQIASIFQPISGQYNISDAILDLVSHQSYKILTIRTAPHVPSKSSPFEPTPKWGSLKRTLEKTLKEPLGVRNNLFENDMNEIVNSSKSIGNALIYRGLNSLSEPSVNERTLFDTDSMYVDWIPKTARFITLHENRKFLSKDKYVTLVSNNSLLWPLLDNFISKSWNTFIHNAYVHQYSKYGIGNDEFLEMFLKMESILKNYKSLN
ncbi:tubulin delta chain-like [Lycorma delicatula]|uniref:tubulin delta chain-like n=1 Tax=Lycorma delicatula TaxID=130591 RepID=UPI003F51534A